LVENIIEENDPTPVVKKKKSRRIPRRTTAIAVRTFQQGKPVKISPGLYQIR